MGQDDFEEGALLSCGLRVDVTAFSEDHLNTVTHAGSLAHVLVSPDESSIAQDACELGRAVT